MSSIAVDALIEISHLMGAPVGSYYSDEVKVFIYEERVRNAFEIARRVIVVGNINTAVPLPPSSHREPEIARYDCECGCEP